MTLSEWVRKPRDPVDRLGMMLFGIPFATSVVLVADAFAVLGRTARGNTLLAFLALTAGLALGVMTIFFSVCWLLRPIDKSWRLTKRGREEDDVPQASEG